MNGSVLTFNAESKDEVMQMLQNDVYTKSGVWNLENVKIYNVSKAVISSSFLLNSRDFDWAYPMRRYNNVYTEEDLKSSEVKRRRLGFYCRISLSHIS